MLEFIQILVILFFAMFAQSIVGFGSALISMPLLVPLIGVGRSAPLVAVVAFAVEIAMVVIYRKSLNFKALTKLTIASLIAIPIGVFLAKILNQQTVEVILGIILIGYGLFALFKFKLPSFKGARWAYFFGGAAGILGGAYNTNGPPIIIYGAGNKWGPDQFRANLQGFFLVNNVLIIFSHLIAGNLTSELWRSFGLAVPVVGLAVLAGTWISKKIPAEKFAFLVQILILLLGINLLV